MFRLLIAGLGLCASLGALAQSPLPTRALPPGTPAPRIDGRLDDPAWQSAPVFDAVRRFRPDVQPDAGPYRTEVRVLVERGALVFGIRAHDPNPADIRAPISRRDQVWPDQDSITVWIDPSGRGQVAQFVRVNAAGSVADGLYAAAVDDEDDSPDFLEVEAATAPLADGWSAEIRWPLAMLRYPLDSARPWRLMLTRRVPRAEPLTFATVPLTREDPHLLAKLQTLDDETALRSQLREARHLVLRPELTLRDQGDGVKANLGLEAQWRPRADWVFDLLWKPDFSQVELDEPQLAGNTRYALFVPEKRSFFLESSDLVGQVQPDNWGISRGLLAFYSRAVSSPRSGLRASWRSERQEATALLVRDTGGGLRLRPDAFNSNSQDADAASTLLFARHRFQLGEGFALAPLLSLRDWADGTRTQVAGADLLWNPSADWRVRGHWLHGGDRHAQDDALWLSARWRQGDWKLQWDSERIGARFVNDNGFVPQNGITRHTLDLLHAFHPESSAITVWEALLRVVQTEALRDPARGVLQRQAAGRLLQPGVWMAAGSSEFYAFANVEQQRTRPGGRLHEPRTLIAGVDLHPGSVWTFAHLELSGGRRVDQDADRTGRGQNLTLQSVWRLPLAAGRNLEWDQRFGAGTVRAPGGGAALDERSLQTKLLLHWRQDQALRLVWQVQAFKRVDEPGVVEGERDRTRTGTLTWLAREGPLRGWSLGGSWSRTDGEPVRRELFVKYQQGWSLL